MNANTKADLQSFIEAVENMAYMVAEGFPTPGGACDMVVKSARQLKSQLYHDETILP